MQTIGHNRKAVSLSPLTEYSYINILLSLIIRLPSICLQLNNFRFVLLFDQTLNIITKENLINFIVLL
jgi:hypothetical protein